MANMSKKMYSNSPKIGKDENGKPKMTRESLAKGTDEKLSKSKVSGEDDGLDERMETMIRHRKEMDEIGARHKGEYDKIFGEKKEK